MSNIDMSLFEYLLVGASNETGALTFLGNSFAVTPNGGLLTCRHVVESLPAGNRLYAVDLKAGNRRLIESELLFPKSPEIDVAFIPNVFGSKEEFLPIIQPDKVTTGTPVNMFGCFSIGRLTTDLEAGYFSGVVVSSREENHTNPWTLTLPFPVLEGMSGSPLTHYHNGTKVHGLVYGNREMRITKSEVVEFSEPGNQYKESINRIVEFGLAYHPTIIIQCLEEMGVTGYIVSNESLKIPGLPQ